MWFYLLGFLFDVGVGLGGSGCFLKVCYLSWNFCFGVKLFEWNFMYIVFWEDLIGEGIIFL